MTNTTHITEEVYNQLSDTEQRKANHDGVSWLMDNYLNNDNMSAYEGSKMQENDQDKNQKFLGHIDDPKAARAEREAHDKFYNDLNFKVWEKANKLSYDEFSGWLKGEDLKIIKHEQ